MATLYQPEIARKRALTYGKIHRKRVPDSLRGPERYEASEKSEDEQDVPSIARRRIAVANPPSNSAKLKSPQKLQRAAVANSLHSASENDTSPPHTSPHRLALPSSAPSNNLPANKTPNHLSLEDVAKLLRSPSDSDTPVSPPKRRRLGVDRVTAFKKKATQKVVVTNATPDVATTVQTASLQQRVPAVGMLKHNALDIQPRPVPVKLLPDHSTQMSGSNTKKSPEASAPSLVLQPKGGNGSVPRTLTRLSPTRRGVTGNISPNKARAPKITSVPTLPHPQRLVSPKKSTVKAIRSTKAQQRSSTSSKHSSPSEDELQMLELTTPESTHAPGDRGVCTSRTPRTKDLWSEILESATCTPLISNVTRPLLRASQSLMLPPRKRLIDTLVDQADGIVSLDYSSDSSNEHALEAISTSYAATVDTGLAPGEAFREAVDEPRHTLHRSQSTTQSSQNSNRMTYGGSRTILASKSPSEKMLFDMPLGDSQPLTRRTRRGSIPVLASLPSFREEVEEEIDQVVSSIRTVHELRQAGANNRFNDEAGDLLDQIHSPKTTGSLKRSALLDLAVKLKSKSFYDMFISHSMDHKLFANIGQEKDLISGFVMLGVLLRMLENGLSANAIAYLLSQKLHVLLRTLLGDASSMLIIAEDRKSNMSKSAQAALMDFGTSLATLQIWGDLQPPAITSRLIALKSLEATIRQFRELGDAGDVMSRDVITMLFDFVTLDPTANSEEVLDRISSVEFQLSLSALEAHSLKTKTTSEEQLWLLNFLPIIRDVLVCTLNIGSNDVAPQKLLALRLALNVTNNNAAAADIFAQHACIQAVGDAIVQKFDVLNGFMLDEERDATVDQLVLMLGFLINFAEWSVLANSCFQELRGSSNDPLHKLVNIFATNLDRMAEAFSQEDAQRNIPFGYLAVLLAYICLMPAAADIVRARLRIFHLITAVEEFLSYNASIDELMIDADGHNANATFTRRLQDMVEKLKVA